MDFNSFCQIELYLDKRILDWRFYILGWAGGRGQKAEGRGQEAEGAGEKVKGKRNKFNLSPFPRLVSLPVLSFVVGEASRREGSNHTPFPFPIPYAQTQELKSDLKVYTTELLLKDS
ncbi:hypothetical protein NIES25_60910 (plasmid) [Nostoc linckia NIES-25]|nr:hypothetical protein NIES25_60910 [Nostoc linckia NIES-25]